QRYHCAVFHFCTSSVGEIFAPPWPGLAAALRLTSAPHALRGRVAIWCVPTTQNLAGREGLPASADATLDRYFGVFWVAFGPGQPLAILKMLTPVFMYIKRGAKPRMS